MADNNEIKRNHNKKRSTHSKEPEKRNTSKTNTGKKKKRTKFGDKHPKLALFIKIMIILILLLTVVGSGILVGYVFGFFGDDFDISEEELKIAASNSVVVDSEGNVIADLSGDERRKIVRLDQMAAYLPKAYVAIEDERFYNHHGIDIKRTGAAIVTYVFNAGKSGFGGSTITQQLVKNITQDTDRSIFRKVKEWAKAYQVEKILNKEEILELYLNILFVGGNNYGVELGAQYYFNTTAANLNLAQCAFLAGINNSPNAYNPYDTSVDNSEKIKTRTLTVLNKMKELGYIENEQDYNDAVAQVEAGLTFTKGETTGNVYSYHTDAAIAQVVEQVAEEKSISTQLAENYVYSSGLTIYTTQVSSVQSALEAEFAKTDTYARKSKKTKDENGEYVHSQAAMVVIDHTTGYVVGTVGGLGDKTESRGLNRATQSVRQTGSSMKPIATVVPGLQEGIITAATTYDDSETEFAGGYAPKNYNKFRGVISVRDALETSQNIPFVKIMAELTPQKSIEYLKKMGVSTLDDTKDAGLAMAIGGLTNGISPLEMAAAYATIANDGVYIEPTFYTKVTDVNGETVLEPKQKTETVMSKSNAYIAKNLLTQPVVGASGTATYCKVQGMDTAAKTGTTNDNYDRWLCGFTPYYTAATWYGYDVNEEIIYSGRNPAGSLWSNVMKNIHTPLPNASFVVPEDIVTKEVCTITGGLATSKCSSKRSEIFVSGTEPAECEGHSGSYTICTESGLLATEFCPNTQKKYTGTVLPKEQLNLWETKSSIGKNGSTAPTATCTIHTAPAEQPEEPTAPQDSQGPVIKLNGSATMTLTVGDTFTDPGATASDNVDGDITSKITKSGTVDTSTPGTYTIVYSVTDSAGNKTTKKRTVRVVAGGSSGGEGTGGEAGGETGGEGSEGGAPVTPPAE